MVLTLFGRNVEIQVAHKIFSLTSFDIEFNIDNAVGKSGTDVQPSARADISIWNLSDDSIVLFKVGATVQVRAGYADDLDTILLGSIKAATPERDGADVYYGTSDLWNSHPTRKMADLDSVYVGWKRRTAS